MTDYKTNEKKDSFPNLKEVCASIRNYKTHDMFTELILSYFLEIYEEIENIVISDSSLHKDSFRTESLRIFSNNISKRFRKINYTIPKELKLIIESELKKRVNEFFKDYFQTSDISKTVWEELIDVASDMYLDFFQSFVEG
jgi:hypothetical protein